MAGEEAEARRPRQAAVAATVAEMALVVGVFALKLALVYGRPLCPHTHPLDDILYLRHADSILDGQWLGHYGPLTLRRVPFFPVFLALCSRLGVPFLLAQEIVYLAAAGLMVLSLAPVVRSRIARLGLLTGLVLNPITLSSDPTSIGIGAASLLREHLYTSLTLLVLAGLTGLWTHGRSRLRIRMAWSLCLGVSLGMFWLTREEREWILPSLLLGVVVGVVPSLRPRIPWKSRLEAFLPHVVWLLCWTAVIGLVSALNWSHYGVFTTSEPDARPYAAAYGALTRVRHPMWTPNVPVPRAVRVQIYAVSPAFAELEPVIEGNRWWFDWSCERFPHTCGDLATPFFTWAVRDAATAKAHHTSALEAASFYTRLATEIDLACDAGRLACDAPRMALTDPIRRYHVERFPATVAHAVPRILRLSDVRIATAPCEDTNEPTAAMYRRVAGQSVGPTDAVPGGWQIEWSGVILDAYRWAVPRLIVVALLGYSASWLALLVVGRSPLLLPSTFVLLAVGSRFALLALAELVAAVPYEPRYYQPNLCLLLLFIGLGTVDLLGFGGRALRRARDRDGRSPPLAAERPEVPHSVRPPRPDP